MPSPEPALAPATSRLGQLQRGRGQGFLQVCAAGAAAHDDLYACVLGDPRVDPQLEARARYYGELVVATALPLGPVAAALAASAEPQLGHDVLAAAFCLGHPEAVALLADPATEAALHDPIVAALWGEQWARRVDLPPRAQAVYLRLAVADTDCARSAERPRLPTALGHLPVAELLDLSRDARYERRDRLVGELCARDGEELRAQLAAVVEDDVVYPRVRLAARALGLLDDLRLLPLAEAQFAREDVFTDPRRRLSGLDRMRRSCLADYVQHLPAPRALALARAWQLRGGYFTTVAGAVFRDHAVAADRGRLEAFVAEHRGGQGGFDVIDELDALGRLADPRSAPLLAEVAREAEYSQARRRAVHALAAMPELPVAQELLREALWDAEDETAADGCAFGGAWDAAARARVVALAGSPVVVPELRERAAQRLRREAVG